MKVTMTILLLILRKNGGKNKKKNYKDSQLGILNARVLRAFFKIPSLYNMFQNQNAKIDIYINKWNETCMKIIKYLQINIGIGGFFHILQTFSDFGFIYGEQEEPGL